MNITQFLTSHGFHEFEGYSQQVPRQVEDLLYLTNRPKINVMEIGFNAGHSAELFLQHNPGMTLTSFDLGEHPYVIPAKYFIDTVYPQRHTLILGDSRETIPAYAQKNPDTRFDVIFIDGGHEYEIAKKDIENCFHLAHSDTLILLDDTMYTSEWGKSWTIGPTRAWMEQIQERKIIEFYRRDYGPGRGMSWGKYCMEKKN